MNLALSASSTTVFQIQAATGLLIERFLSGPLVGDQQIGALIAANALHTLIFSRDPPTSQPHPPDVSALIRLCDVYLIPLATNMGTAEILVRT
ncbi:methylglyoxal synthase, partial [Bacillus subtilis]